MSKALIYKCILFVFTSCLMFQCKTPPPVDIPPPTTIVEPPVYSELFQNVFGDWEWRLTVESDDCMVTDPVYYSYPNDGDYSLNFDPVEGVKFFSNYLEVNSYQIGYHSADEYDNGYLNNSIRFFISLDSLSDEEHSFRGEVNEDSMATEFAFPFGTPGVNCYLYTNIFVRR